MRLCSCTIASRSKELCKWSDSADEVLLWPHDDLYRGTQNHDILDVNTMQWELHWHMQAQIVQYQDIFLKSKAVFIKEK